MNNYKVDNNKRIAKNTILLYVRMILLILVQLYTVPIVLDALGLSDYGLYNVVGGIVTLFSFIGGSLASGTQRFIAFALGKGDLKEVKKIFDITVSVYFQFGIIALIIIELIGVWFINTQMTIQEDRLYAANWVFQLSLFAFLINLISTPYNSAVIAHERMTVFAYVSVLECLLKLCIALFLPLFVGDRLILYSVLIFLLSLIVRVIYQIYCRSNFPECRNVTFSYEPGVYKELLSYSGWNMIGYIAILFRQQGINIVQNIFFSTILNAAHSIAQQINGVLTQFVHNVYVATRPQITKLYASGDISNMWKLVFLSSKFAFYLLSYLCIPILVELNTILNIWLRNVPDYTVSISFLMIISLLLETLCNPIIGVYQAANKIKKYQLYSSTIIMLNIPVSYVLLRMFPHIPLIPYTVSIFFSVLYVLSILWNAFKELDLNLFLYTRDVLLKVISVFLISFFITSGVISLISPSFIRLLLTCMLSFIITTCFIWNMGMNYTEREFTHNIIKQKLKKLTKR